MPTIGTIFEVYLNINIMLVVALLGWIVARSAMAALGLKHAYDVKLQLIKALLIVSFVAPLLIILFDTYIRPTGAVSYSMSLSDLVVAQYIQGNFQLKAAELDALLGLRTRMTEEFLAIQSIYAFAAFTLLLAGVIIGLVRLLVSIVTLRQILRKSYAWRRFGRLHLRLSDTVTTPFSTRDLLNRYIVLPTAMLESSTDQRIALGHELQHIRQKDTEWEVALEFLRPFFFWNPAFLLLKRRIEALRELSCDQQVIMRRTMNVEEYCQCLLRTCERGLRKREVLFDPMPRVAFVQIDSSPVGTNSAQFLRHRVLSLLEGGCSQRRVTSAIALIVPVLALVGFASVMLQKPNDWSHDRIMFSTILNLDRLADRNY